MQVTVKTEKRKGEAVKNDRKVFTKRAALSNAVGGFEVRNVDRIFNSNEIQFFPYRFLLLKPFHRLCECSIRHFIIAEA